MRPAPAPAGPAPLTAAPQAGATIAPVADPAAVLGLVRRGMEARVARRTDLNAHSSRSHLVVTLRANRRSLLHDGAETYGRRAAPAAMRPLTVRGRHSRLQLVDLAGSENAKMAGSEGAGLQEARAINRSLSALAGVLMALAKRLEHVPYRDSKLTRLLKDALGGDAKMLMVVCVAPEEPFAAESLQSLRFGTKARTVVKGQAQRRIVY